MKTGQTVILRSARESDAEMLLELMKAVCGQTRGMVLEPEEITTTVERERELLRRNCADDQSLVLAAFIDKKLVGNCSFGPAGKRNRTKHRCAVGISVSRDFWSMGIGTALMEETIRCAGAAGFEQMELEVVSSNAPAIALYRKTGFEATGTIPRALKCRDGTYEDFLFMSRRL